MEKEAVEGYGKIDSRMYFLDNLRASIVLLVIVFHVAIGYMSPAPQWWYVVDSQNSSLFNLFVMNTDVFIMPMMFLLAGYFAVPALQKKGIKLFLRGKFVRIVIPWIGGVLFLAPAITYMIWYSRSDTPPEYFSYVKTMFFKADIYNHAHYWFLGQLSYLFLALAAIYYVKPSIFQKKITSGSPSLSFFLLFGLITTITFFIPNLFFHSDLWFHKLYILSLQPTRFIAYIFYFALGIYAWKNQWFTVNGYMPSLGKWFSLAIVMMLVFTGYRITFTDTTPILLKVGHAVLHSYLCLTCVFALIALFNQKVNSKAYLWRKVAANSYTIYYIHQLIVLPVTYMVRKMEIPILIKYLSVAGTCVILCFLVSEYVVSKINKAVLR